MNRFVIAEPRLCIGCNTCAAACVMVHKAVGLQSIPRLTITRTEQGTAPILCRQCEDAPCAKVCPVGAITHEDDAIVLNESLCVGCKLCAIACPFGAITPHGSSPVGMQPLYGDLGRTAPQSHALSPILAWTAGVRSVAVKCDLCHFSPQGPECVKVCPTRAIFLVDAHAIEHASETKRRNAAAALGEHVASIAPPEQA